MGSTYDLTKDILNLIKCKSQKVIGFRCYYFHSWFPCVGDEASSCLMSAVEGTEYMSVCDWPFTELGRIFFLLHNSIESEYQKSPIKVKDEIDGILSGRNITDLTPKTHFFHRESCVEYLKTILVDTNVDYD